MFESSKLPQAIEFHTLIIVLYVPVVRDSRHSVIYLIPRQKRFNVFIGLDTILT